MSTTRNLIRELFLARADRGFGGRCPPSVRAIVERAASRGPLVAEDAAAFVALGAEAIADGADPAQVATGLQVWAGALERRPDVQGIQRDHRGAVLAALECAAEVPALWASPAGARAVEAMLDLLVHERQQAVGDRNGMSFAVFERLCPAIIHASPEVLALVPGHVAGLLAENWTAARAHPLEGLPITAAESPTIDEVPFGRLCRTEPHPVVSDLRALFVSQARRDIRLYDVAPLAVVSASELLQRMQETKGALPPDLLHSLLPLAADSWGAMLDTIAGSHSH